MKSTNLQSPTPVRPFPYGNWLTKKLSGTTVLSHSYNADAQLVKMVDLTGTTTYAYDAQDRLLSVSGPWANSTVRYGYDNYSRVTSRVVGSATQSFVYDSLGRLSSENNPLGTFEYAYETTYNGRVTQMNYPNGMTLKLSYLPASQEKRLGEIRYETAGVQLISRHAYSYSPAGNIQSWTQQSGTDAPKVYQFGYDQIDQLVTALQTQNNSTVNDYAYRYDLAGNRTQEQINGQPKQAIYNQLNQLIAASAGGKMRFAGQTNKETWVSVSGQPAKKLPDNKFEAWVDVYTGVNQINIVAVDANKNQRTNTYQVTVPAITPQMLSYDADGDLLEDGNRKFTWNAKNQLTKIQYLDGTGTTEFMYDGVGRRTKIIEKNSAGTIQSETRYLWVNDNQPVEERDASNNVVKRYYKQGEQIANVALPNNKLYYTRDHLGSIRELINASGQIQAIYDYKPYGERTKLIGNLDTIVSYTGHHQHTKSNLYLAWYRQYDPRLGRWLSRDPIEESGGINMYRYAENSLPNNIDLLGLCGSFTVTPTTVSGFGQAGAFSTSYNGAGYEVQFIDDNCCKCGDIRLVQALKQNSLLGLAGTPWFIDASGKKYKENSSTLGGIPVPGYTNSGGVIGNSAYSFKDSPGGNPFYPVSYSAEVCAICSKNGKDSVIGCISFNWNSNKKKLSETKTSTTSGEGFNTATQNWQKQGGK